MSYDLIKTESKPRGDLVRPYYIWRCRHCGAMAVTRETHEKPPTHCGVCRR